MHGKGAVWDVRLPAGSPPPSPGGLMTLSPSRPPFDLKIFALCSQYHGLDQICNTKMHSKINNFRHRESKSVRIYKKEEVPFRPFFPPVEFWLEGHLRFERFS